MSKYLMFSLPIRLGKSYVIPKFSLRIYLFGISVPDIYVNPIYTLSYVLDYGSFDIHITDFPEIEFARSLIIIF
jgi:hypothetical protein